MILAQQQPPAGDGAPIADILLVGGIISAATVAVLAIVVAHRRGVASPIAWVGVQAERYLGLPGWAAIPGILAIGAAILTFLGAIWDIGVHIDKGRDNGPFGTTAHYPLLAGLVGTYLCGVLAIGLAPRKPGPGFVSIPGLWHVPIGALLIAVGGAYAMLGFPLDDLWHRVFGQDVTLWGPTHTMFFGGLITAATGAVVLLAQGVRSLGRDPFAGWAPWKYPLAGVAGGIFLFVGCHITDEFNWGLPQYRQVWQPLLLAGFGGFGLILARSLGGRGATLGALLAFLPLQLFEVGLIGFLDTTQPATVLFVAEAVIVEAICWRAARRLSFRTAALAGLGVGTLGFGAEYAWSQVAMPLEWQPSLIAEGLPTAALAGVAGGLLAAAFAGALTGEPLKSRFSARAVAIGAAVLVAGLSVNAGIAHEAGGATATMTLTNEREAETPGGAVVAVADLEVTLSDPELAEDPNWAYVLGWQGGGRFNADLVSSGDGVLRSDGPVPIGGGWKTFVRVHDGRTLVAAAVRMPADDALGFEGFPAEPTVERPLVADTELLQIEQKDDGPMWAWTPAMMLVMGLNVSLMVLLGVATSRSRRDPTDPPAGTSRQAPPRSLRAAEAGS